ncbi:uncharacterized protein [Dermacentor albipictus]
MTEPVPRTSHGVLQQPAVAREPTPSTPRPSQLTKLHDPASRRSRICTMHTFITGDPIYANRKGSEPNSQGFNATNTEADAEVLGLDIEVVASACSFHDMCRRSSFRTHFRFTRELVRTVVPM